MDDVTHNASHTASLLPELGDLWPQSLIRSKHSSSLSLKLYDPLCKGFWSRQIKDQPLRLFPDNGP